MAGVDLYDVLGVSSTCTKAEIKKAYHKVRNTVDTTSKFKTEPYY